MGSMSAFDCKNEVATGDQKCIGSYMYIYKFNLNMNLIVLISQYDM